MKHLGPRFWLGVIVAVIGVLILLELFTDIRIPIFSFVFGLVFLLIGGRMIAQSWGRRDTKALTGDAVMAKLDFSQAGMLDRDARFDVVLGRSTIDLTKLAEPAHDVTVTIDTLFGHALVKLPPVAYDIESSAAFGQVRMPDRTTTSMGDAAYHAPSDHASRLHVRVHATFGACQLVEAS